MRNAQINVNINSRKATKSMRDMGGTIGETEEKARKLTEELRDMRDELARMESGSKEFQEMAYNAADLERHIKTASAQVKVLSSETIALDQAIGIIQGLAGAYGMVQGATALLGVENEKLMEVLVKLQAIQAVTNGLNQVSNMLSERSAAGILLRTIRTKLLNTTLTANNRITVQSTIATRALGTAMNTLPILAIITALSAIVYGLSRYYKESKETAKATKELQENQQTLQETLEENRGKIASTSTEYVSLIYQLKATNTNSKERLSLINRINSQYGTTLQNLKDETKFQNQLNDAIDVYIAKMKDKLMFSINEDKITELLKERISLEEILQDALKDEDEILRVNQANLIRRQNTLRANNKITQEQYENNIRGIRENNKELTETARIEYLRSQGFGEYVRQLDDINNKLLNLGKSQLDLGIIPTETGGDIGDTVDKYFQEYTDANKRFFDAMEQERISRLTNELDTVLQKEADNYDRLIELAEAAGQDTVEITANYQNLVQAIHDEHNEKVKQNRIETNNEILILNEEINRQEELNLAKSEEEKKNIREKYNKILLPLKQQQLKDEERAVLSNTNLTEEERNKIIKEYALKNSKLIADSLVIGDEQAEIIEASWYETMDGILSVASNTIGQLGQMMSAIHQNQMTDLQNEANFRNRMYEEESSKYEDMLENQVIGREEYDAKMKQLEINKRNDELIARRKEFQANKRARISEAIMGIAQGIISGLGAPFPMNIAMPILAGITGAVQLATIKKEQFKANKGGLVPGQPSKRDSVSALLAPGEAVINSTSNSGE